MLQHSKSGLVIFAKELETLVGFYSALLPFRIVERDANYVILAGEGCDLTILQPPDPVRATMQVSSPPAKRENVAMKPVFYIRDINAVRDAATRLGGHIFPVEKAWEFHGYTVCDGYDPEGNIFQLRSKLNAKTRQQETI